MADTSLTDGSTEAFQTYCVGMETTATTAMVTVGTFKGRACSIKRHPMSLETADQMESQYWWELCHRV